jgi:hypothetical protein
MGRIAVVALALLALAIGAVGAQDAGDVPAPVVFAHRLYTSGAPPSSAPELQSFSFSAAEHETSMAASAALAEWAAQLETQPPKAPLERVSGPPVGSESVCWTDRFAFPATLTPMTLNTAAVTFRDDRTVHLWVAHGVNLDPQGELAAVAGRYLARQPSVAETPAPAGATDPWRLIPSRKTCRRGSRWLSRTAAPKHRRGPRLPARPRRERPDPNVFRTGMPSAELFRGGSEVDATRRATSRRRWSQRSLPSRE